MSRIAQKIKLPNYIYKGEYVSTSNKKYYMNTLVELKKIIDDYETFPDLGSLLNHLNNFQFLSQESLRKLCYGMERGVFDDFINDYLSPLNLTVRNYLDNYYFNHYSISERLFNITDMVNGNLYNDGRALPFNIMDVIYIRDNLHRYAIGDFIKKEIIEDSGVTNQVNDLLWNLRKGIFDESIKKYEDNPFITLHHRPVTYIKHVKKMDIFGLRDNRFVYKNNHLSPFTVEDLVKVKKELLNFEEYPTNKSLGELLGVSSPNIYNRVIWNLEEEVFDEWIDIYYNGSDDEKSIKVYHDTLYNRLKGVEPYKIIEMTNRNLPRRIIMSNKAYEFYFKYEDKKGHVRVSNFNREDVKKLIDIYKKSNEYISFETFYNALPNFSELSVRRILKSIILGVFEKYDL